MRTAPFSSDHLNVRGLEIVLPAVLCIEGDDATVLAAFASSHIEGVLGPLVSYWLAREFRTTFSADADSDCSLAGDAFCDKLAADFASPAGLVAALVTGLPAVRPCQGSQARDPLTQFMQGDHLVRWHCSGIAYAHVNCAHRSAVVLFDGMPGALALNCGSARGKKQPKPYRVQAWYGFGRVQTRPDDILDALGQRARLPYKARREHALHV